MQNVPEEDCTLNPRRVCTPATKVVPGLEEEEKCLEEPKEVCVSFRTNPRKVLRPAVKLWCHNWSQQQQQQQGSGGSDIQSTSAGGDGEDDDHEGENWSANILTAVQCQLDDFEIECPEGSLIDIVESNYGRTDTDVCNIREGPRQWRNVNCFGVDLMPVKEE